jgi:hypothetical protein
MSPSSSEQSPNY